MRLILAVAVAVAAALPMTAHATPVCVTYGNTYAVCTETSQPGCVYGHTDRVSYWTEPTCG